MMKNISSDRSIKFALLMASVCTFAIAQQPQPVQPQQPVQAQPQTVQPAQPAQPVQTPAQAQPAQAQADPDWGAAMAEGTSDAKSARLTAGIQDADAATRYKETIRGGVRRGTELSAEALSAAPFLYLERNAQGRIRPDNTKLLPSKDRAAYQLFDRAMVRPSGNVSFEIGDTVDVVKADSLVSFRGNVGRVVTRVGRARVEEKVGKRYVIRLNEMWGIIRGGEGILPVTRFEAVYCDNLAEPETEIRGTILKRVDNTTTPYMHQYLIIDRGEDDGVRIGDFFKATEKKPEGQLSEEVLEAQVVNVTPVSATLVIQKLAKPNLKAGDHVFLNRRPMTVAAEPAAPEPIEHNEQQPVQAQ